MGSSEVSRYGWCGFLHDDCNNDPKGVTMTYTQNYFQKGWYCKKSVNGDIKTIEVHLCFPLLLDVSTLDILNGWGRRLNTVRISKQCLDH